MSIANLVVQPDAAYIVTDSGYFRPDGRIIYLGVKSIVVAETPVAIAATGSCGALLPKAALEMHNHDEPEDFTLDGFRDLIRMLYEREGLDPVRDYSRWVAAYYSRQLGKAVGFSFFTNPADDTKQPWVWHPVNVVLMPMPAPADVWGNDIVVDLKDPAAFDPPADFMKIVGAQRRKRRGWAHDPDQDICSVAGEIWLTKVSADGVEDTLLHTYPDRVGELAGRRLNVG